MANIDFKYFSFVVLYVLILYAVLLLVFLCVRRREIKVRHHLNRPQNIFHDRNHNNEEYYSFNWTTTVEDVTESWMGGDVARMILLGTRVISSLYLLFGGLAFYGSQYPVSFYYFEGWTLILTTIYFLFATFLSGLKVAVVRARAGLDTRLNPYYAIVDWTYTPRFLAVTCHLLYEICCASNFLSAFGVIFQASPDSDDIVIATSISICLLFLDLGLNNLKFRFDQFPASFAWVVFYLMCIWPAVFTGSMRKWPYEFLAVDTRQCFVYYTLVFVGQFISFLVWYLFFYVKRVFLYYLEFHGILIPITQSNPYALADYRNLEWDTESQASRSTSRSRDSLRSRGSRHSGRHSDTSSVYSADSSNHGSVVSDNSHMVVNSFLFTGDATTDFNEEGVAMQSLSSMPHGYDYYGNMMMMMPPPQPSMWPMPPMPMIPPPPSSMYPMPMPMDNSVMMNQSSESIFTGQNEEGKGEGFNGGRGEEKDEEKKATMSEEELALSQQQQQQLELQRLQQQTLFQQQQQLQHQQSMGFWPPPTMMVPPFNPAPNMNDPTTDLLRSVPSLQDPAYLLEQQQQLYLFNLLHNKDGNAAESATVTLPGANEQDVFNPSFPTVPPVQFLPVPQQMPLPGAMDPQTMGMMGGYPAGSMYPYPPYPMMEGGYNMTMPPPMTEEQQQQYQEQYQQWMLQLQQQQQQQQMAMMPPSTGHLDPSMMHVQSGQTTNNEMAGVSGGDNPIAGSNLGDGTTAGSALQGDAGSMYPPPSMHSQMPMPPYMMMMPPPAPYFVPPNPNPAASDMNNTNNPETQMNPFADPSLAGMSSMSFQPPMMMDMGAYPPYDPASYYPPPYDPAMMNSGGGMPYYGYNPNMDVNNQYPQLPFPEQQQPPSTVSSNDAHTAMNDTSTAGASTMEST